MTSTPNGPPSRAAAATYTVVHAGGSTAVPVNQRVAAHDGWHFLGSFEMAPASGHRVELASDPDETVSADAIYVVASGSPSEELSYI